MFELFASSLFWLDFFPRCQIWTRDGWVRSAKSTSVLRRSPHLQQRVKITFQMGLVLLLFFFHLHLLSQEQKFFPTCQAKNKLVSLSQGPFVSLFSRRVTTTEFIFVHRLELFFLNRTAYDEKTGYNFYNLTSIKIAKKPISIISLLK